MLNREQNSGGANVADILLVTVITIFHFLLGKIMLLKYIIATISTTAVTQQPEDCRCFLVLTVGN